MCWCAERVLIQVGKGNCFQLRYRNGAKSPMPSSSQVIAGGGAIQTIRRRARATARSRIRLALSHIHPIPGRYGARPDGEDACSFVSALYFFSPRCRLPPPQPSDLTKSLRSSELEGWARSIE